MALLHLHILTEIDGHDFSLQEGLEAPHSGTFVQSKRQGKVTLETKSTVYVLWQHLFAPERKESFFLLYTTRFENFGPSCLLICCPFKGWCLVVSESVSHDFVDKLCVRTHSAIRCRSMFSRPFVMWQVATTSMLNKGLIKPLVIEDIGRGPKGLGVHPHEKEGLSEVLLHEQDICSWSIGSETCHTLAQVLSASRLRVYFELRRTERSCNTHQHTK